MSSNFIMQTGSKLLRELFPVQNPRTPTSSIKLNSHKPIHSFKQTQSQTQLKGTNWPTNQLNQPTHIQKIKTKQPKPSAILSPTWNKTKNTSTHLTLKLTHLLKPHKPNPNQTKLSRSSLFSLTSFSLNSWNKLVITYMIYQDNSSILNSKLGVGWWL